MRSFIVLSLIMVMFCSTAISQDPTSEVDEIRAELAAAAKPKAVPTKIKGSVHAMNDISELRNEINSAVKHNMFIPLQDNSATKPNKHKVVLNNNDNKINDDKIPFFKKFDLFKFLRGLRKKEAVQSNLKVADEFVSSAAATTIMPRKLITPNIIESASASKKGGGRPFDESSLSLHRETLQLLAVTEDLTFKLGSDNVRAWKTVQATQQKHVLVGMTNNRILLVVEQKGSYQMIQAITFEGNIASFTVFLKWNGRAMEGIVVVALVNELIFIRIDDTLQKMDIVWKWTIHQTVQTMLYFRLNDFDTLLLTHHKGDSVESADIYRIDLPAKYTWLLQKIPLDAPCQSVEFVDIGRDSVICFAQNDSVELYRYTHGGVHGDGPAATMQRFEHFESIYAPNVQTVATFRIGGLAYIAIGGRRPQILRYYREQFHSQTILSASWGTVEQIVAIPARTYRDDLIVFVQHRIAFASHSIPTLEALIWNGLAFETAAYSVPCYIGDVVADSGITCVLDLDRDEGLAGASIIQRGTQISLLVPRHEAPSGLFHLKFQLIPTMPPPAAFAGAVDPNEPLHNLVAKQDSSIEMARVAVRNSFLSLASDEIVHDLESTSIEADAFEMNGDHLSVGELWVGQRQWSLADLDEDVEALLVELKACQRAIGSLEQSFTKTRNASKPAIPIERIPSSATANGLFNINSFHLLRDKRGGNEDAQRITVTNLNVDHINGVPVTDFIFMDSNGNLDLGAHELRLSDELSVDESVQIIPVAEARSGADEDTKVETSLHVTGNVIVDRINDMHWSELVNKMVMTNLDYELYDVEVDGEIVMNGKSLTVPNINDIPFPSGYLWNEENAETAIINGNKTFTGILRTDAMDGDGLIDGVSTFEVITLSGEQFISGPITFHRLEVTEEFHVTGKITGKHLNDFLANPSLVETKLIQSACSFHNLHVNGPIIVADHFHTIELDRTLADVIYKSNPSSARCTSSKTFGSLTATDIQLTSNLLNGIPIETFLTTDTEQSLTINQLNGMILFKSLQLTKGGNYDLVNVTELDENSIKLFGDQYTETELIFANDDDQEFDLIAEQLNVEKIINGVMLAKCIRVDDPIELRRNFQLDAAIIEELIVDSDGLITAEFGARISNDGITLVELDAKRLSLVRPQDISGSTWLQSAEIVGDFDVANINQYPIEQFQQLVKNVKNVEEYLRLDDDLKVVRLIVDGDIQIGQINGHDIEAIINNAIWLNRPNEMMGDFYFLNSPIIVNDLTVAEVINEEPIQPFIDGLVLRTHLDNLIFTETMSFPNGFLLDRVDAEYIGAVRAMSILNVNSMDMLPNEVLLHGNLFVKDLIVGGRINGASKNLFDAYRFDDEHQLHSLLCDVHFGAIQTDSLHLSALNELKQFDGFLKSIIRKDSGDYRSLAGKKVFSGKVEFLKDITIEMWNGVNVQSLLENIVLNVPDDAVVEIGGNVAFTGAIYADRMHVRGDVLASTVMGCTIGDWLRDSIRINENVEFTERITFAGGDSFVAANVHALNVNGIVMRDVLTKHTEQNVTGGVNFSKIYSAAAIVVEGSGKVNGFDLRTERTNTVMVHGNNYITAPTTMQSARVLDSLQTIGLVNGKDIQLAAQLNGEILLHGAVSFGAVTFDALNTKEQISGIDLDAWTEQSLKRYGLAQQTVTANWTIGELILNGNIAGDGQLNGHNMVNVAQQLQDHRSEIVGSSSLAHQQNYQAKCRRLRELVKKSRTAQYSLSHFDQTDEIIVSDVIRSIFHFFNGTNHWMTINVGCHSSAYKWNSTKGHFKNVSHTETGHVDQWIQVDDLSLGLHLISNGMDSFCSVSGMNIWKFNGSSNRLELLRNVGVGGEYTQMHSVPTQNGFFALKHDKVVKFDLYGNVIDNWQLPATEPSEDRNAFRFVPSDVNLGLALSDGSRLSVLSPNGGGQAENLHRRKRTIDLINDLIKQQQSNEPQQLQGLLAIPYRNVSGLPSEPGFFDGFFERKEGKLMMSPNSSSTANIKLHLYPSATPVVPEFWPNRFRASPATTPSPNEFEDYDDEEIVGMQRTEQQPKTKTESKMERDISDSQSVPVVNESTSSTVDLSPKSEMKNSDPLIKQVIEESPASSGARTDLFGHIEALAKPIADEITDAIVDFKQTESEDLNDDVGNALSESHTHKILSEESPASSGARTDLFGHIEALAKPIADEITDAIVDFKQTESEDLDNDVGITLSENMTVSEESPASSGARTDLLGHIEALAKPIADEITDTIVDFKQSESEDLDDDIDVALSKNRTIPSTISEESPASSGGRTDLFGHIEAMAKPIADEITDAIVDFKLSESEDLDDDVGIASSKNKTKPIFSEESPASSGARTDLFGHMEALAKPIADKITDAIVDFKETKSEDLDDDVGVALFGNQITKNLSRTPPREANASDVEVVKKSNSDPIIVENKKDIKLNQSNETRIESKKDEAENGGQNAFSTSKLSSSTQSPDVSGIHINASQVGGVLNIFRKSIQDVWITYHEGKQLIKDLRKEIRTRHREDEEHRHQHRHHNKHHHHHRKDYDDYDDDDEEDPYVSVGRTEMDLASNDDLEEPVIARPILVVGGVATTENLFLPSRNDEAEIVSIVVGAGGGQYQKSLVAVSTWKKHTVANSNDFIRIYEDIIEGRLFQTIACHRPRSLTTFHVRDETLLAFIENESDIQIYIYHGIEGFTIFTHISIGILVEEMQAIMVPASKPFVCPRTMLAIRTAVEIRFLEAISYGFCGVNVALDCD